MPRRANSTSFRPGQSGNPNGRPRVLADVQNAAREHSTEAIGTLARIMRNPKAPAAAQIAAACALLDRGYGKPSQAIEATNTNVVYTVSDKPMTEEEWIAERVTEHCEIFGITFIRSRYCPQLARKPDVETWLEQRKGLPRSTYYDAPPVKTDELRSSPISRRSAMSLRPMAIAELALSSIIEGWSLIPRRSAA
jgi:hypothetical protein